MVQTLRQQQHAWAEKYPNSCKICLGWGDVVDPEHPGEWAEEPCACWTDEGLCPRCKDPLNLDGNYHRCDNCGWDYNDSTRGMPFNYPAQPDEKWPGQSLQ
jgi:hypothetical protein